MDPTFEFNPTALNTDAATLNRILIIDDESSMRDLCRLYLKDDGYIVEVCDDVNNAYPLLEKNRFDLVLSDLSMPDGNGVDLVKTIKYHYPHTSVIIMTAFGSVETAVESMRSGAYDYITKPFPRDLLLATVRRCLESHNLKREVSKMQAELLKQERLVTIGSMGGAIAHRMRNPLNIIQMCAQYLETRIGIDEENMQVLRAIQEKVKTLEALTRDFVEYSRASRIRRAPEQIDRLINDVITNVAPRCKIQEVTILRDFEPDLPQIDVDADLIREVFTNIIDNALEAMKGTGRIWVAMQLARNAPFLHVAIANTGSVLSDEIAERIFEPFFTTKETGMGLGLAIVRQVVEAHGGVIQAIGDPKKKTTTFHVHLPLQKSGETK